MLSHVNMLQLGGSKQSRVKFHVLLTSYEMVNMEVRPPD